MTKEEREKAIEIMSRPFSMAGAPAEIIEAHKMAIKALKQEPKTGHWIWTLEDWSKWECSECGFTKRTDVHVELGYKYCPKCGARMEG